MRHQPPVYSPLSGRALLRMTRSAAGDDAIGRLRALLLRDYAADGLVLCGSGTQALRLAIQAAARRFGPGVPVAIPGFTCFDVAAAAVAVGHPLLVFDIDPDTLAPDPDSVARTLEAGARVLVVSPLYGVPVPWEPLARLAAEHDAILIEDSAQGHGARWDGRPLGSLGAVSVLSFGRGKGWTGGRGGAVLFRHGLARAALESGRTLRPAAGGIGLFGPTAAQWLLGRPALYGIPASVPWLGLGETRYRDAAPPAALAPAAARLLLATRAAARAEAGIRRENGAHYTARLAGRHDVIPIAIARGGTAGYLRFPLRIPARSTVARDRNAARRLGIAASYPAPIGSLPPVRRLLSGAGERAWPGAETLVRELVTLPTHSRISDRERERILGWAGAGT